MFSAALADEVVGIASKADKPPTHTKPTPEPLLLSVNDSAATLNLGRSTVWEMIKSGELPSIKIRGRRLIRRADIDRLLSG
jgi:excisionase family DNA binding protein